MAALLGLPLHGSLSALTRRIAVHCDFLLRRPRPCGTVGAVAYIRMWVSGDAHLPSPGKRSRVRQELSVGLRFVIAQWRRQVAAAIRANIFTGDVEESHDSRNERGGAQVLRSCAGNGDHEPDSLE